MTTNRHTFTLAFLDEAGVEQEETTISTISPFHALQLGVDWGRKNLAWVISGVRIVRSEPTIDV